MKKDVLVTVKGLTTGENHDDSMEIVCNGTYYFKNGKHYIRYEEIMEESMSLISNTLKISDKSGKFRVEVKKKGSIETTLIFEEGQSHIACYDTEYGSFMLGFNASLISVEQDENKINIHIDYAMEMNYEYLSDNKIDISIVSKNTMKGKERNND